MLHEIVLVGVILSHDLADSVNMVDAVLHQVAEHCLLLVERVLDFLRAKASEELQGVHERL